MVLALLAMGLGCSEEPPEQWSHPMRQAIVDGCVIGMDANTAGATIERMAEEGYTMLGLCRAILGQLEAEYTESDFQLLSDEERADAFARGATVCREKLLDD